jgi:hypothetical protein
MNWKVTRLGSRLRACVSQEDGGAIVEFVLLRYRYLFRSLSISIASHRFGANEQIARSMAREVLRVYVISENDGAAQEISGRAAQLLARQWQLSDTEVASLRTSMDCSHFPCLTANGRIKLTLSFIDDETQRKFRQVRKSISVHGCKSHGRIGIMQWNRLEF